jgi:hypothetical protein
MPIFGPKVCRAIADRSAVDVTAVDRPGRK